MVKLPHRCTNVPARHGFGTRMLAQSNHVEFAASVAPKSDYGHLGDHVNLPTSRVLISRLVT
jgi:hypothetical protein